MTETTVHIEGGRVRGGRTRQEDAWGFGDIPGGAWALVADGMGGHQAGDQASGAAADAIMQHCLDTSVPITDMEQWLRDGVKAAHRAVEALAGPRHGSGAPGTTLLWAVTHGDTCWFAHIGDSRAYLVRGRQVGSLTTDMTPAGQRVRDGRKPWEHQNTAPDGHILLSCLGHTPMVMEVFAVDWQPGDVVILATDGLNSVPLTRWPQLVRDSRSVTDILNLQPWSDNATLVFLRR